MAAFTASPANAARTLFIGDYSTGDFSQWPLMATKFYGGPTNMLPGASYEQEYPATVVDDPVKGKAARYEVRQRDFVGTTESAQVTTTISDTGGHEGQTTWYTFSARFDESFPQNHGTLGWGVTNQWHDGANEGGSPPISMNVGMRNGHWSLGIVPQNSPGDPDGDAYSIWDVPLGTKWHDIKLQIHWSSRNGWIRLWHNGVRQSLLGSVDTFEVPTLIPGTDSVYYKEGYYRKPMMPTGVVYLSGFSSATDEAVL
ncbi:heparin lyase I family protein [Mycolicibacterium sp. SCSIO 43805]|uniref:heparin lyase I family protein n=1 Tax=Mycolicibacterium sp. SCSIO 43805 TaxID=3378074 RepID=UPI003AB66904